MKKKNKKLRLKKIKAASKVSKQLKKSVNTFSIYDMQEETPENFFDACYNIVTRILEKTLDKRQVLCYNEIIGYKKKEKNYGNKN